MSSLLVGPNGLPVSAESDEAPKKGQASVSSRYSMQTNLSTIILKWEDGTITPLRPDEAITLGAQLIRESETAILSAAYLKALHELGEMPMETAVQVYMTTVRTARLRHAEEAAIAVKAALEQAVADAAMAQPPAGGVS